MLNNSLIIDTLNKILSYSQKSSKFLWENSFFMKKIDSLIYSTILGIFIFSTFASSDVIGYVALITLFLTVIKIFIKPNEKIEVNLFEIFLVIYFLIVIISLAGSSLFHLSLKGFLKTFTYLGFYFSVVQYFKNNIKKIPFTLGVIALCAASQGIVGIFQNFSQVGEISTWQDVSMINPEDVMTRVYGLLQPYNPNLFGGYLVVALPSLIGCFFLFLTEKKFKFATGVLALTLITITSLVLSGCRGAYLGLVTISLFVFGLLGKFIWQNGKEKLRRIFLSVISVFAALSTVIVLSISSIRTRIFSIFVMRQDSSTSFRFNVYQSAFQMAKDNWLLGIGVGNQNFREIYGLYMRTGFDALSSYSVFLEIAVESGVFALIAFVAFLGTLLVKALKFVFENKNLKATIIVSTAVVSVTATMIHGLVDTVFFRPQIQFVFWTMVAFVSVLLNPENYQCCDGEDCR